MHCLKVILFIDQAKFVNTVYVTLCKTHRLRHHIPNTMGGCHKNPKFVWCLGLTCHQHLPYIKKLREPTDSSQLLFTIKNIFINNCRCSLSGWNLVEDWLTYKQMLLGFRFMFNESRKIGICNCQLGSC